MSKFLIRKAQQKDIEGCLAMNHSLETQIVWQIRQQEDAEHIQIVFQTLRLPRPIRVEYPRNQAELKHDLSQLEGLLVAETDGVLLGYAQITLSGFTASVRNLVVDEPWRRRKIGRALVEQARVWAQLHQAKYLSLEASSRSYPAIQFLQGRGLSFCGFNDRYYSNQDIAVFFGQNL